MSVTSDAVIVGGGVIGTALAWGLAQRGLAVTVIESGRIGRGATWAAAGILAHNSRDDPPELTTLCDASTALWVDWAAELEQRSGVGISLRRDGLLDVWVDPEAPHLPPELATEPFLPGRGERLSATEVRELEPSLTGPIVGGVFDPDVGHVDNPRLAPALARAAGELGVRFLIDTPVVELLGTQGRCTGVRAASGLEVAAGVVVVAAGAWSGPLAEASGVRLPMEPWRGQMLTFDAVTRPVRHVVFCGELILVPRGHGPLIVGTTLENVGFDARVTLAGLAQIVARAERLAPGLGDLPLIRTWAGLRPGTPDHLPYLGPVPGWDGLFAATGHGRKGIILAPITQKLMTRLILDHDLDPRLVPCLPSRVIDAAAPQL